MPGSTPNEGYPYPLGSEGPDGPGGIYALATMLDNQQRAHNWVTYTPTTGITLGSGGSLVFAYRWERGDIHVKGSVNFGTSAAMSTLFLSTPVPFASLEWPRAVAARYVRPSTGAIYPLSLDKTGASQVQASAMGAAGTYVITDPNVGTVMAPGNGDFINIDFVYTTA